MRPSKGISITIFFVLLLLSDPLFGQCSMCRAILQSEENTTVAEAINHGIVYLMIIPYILVGLVGFRIIKTLRKKPS
ncbi:MAG: hypothetical protein OXE77_08155 [Flavobacteriaceae bacterium]|nr:hypothetical protein [Flavobacteriaceae bacterium]